jgi:hypothetical protein
VHAVLACSQAAWLYMHCWGALLLRVLLAEVLGSRLSITPLCICMAPGIAGLACVLFSSVGFRRMGFGQLLARGTRAWVPSVAFPLRQCCSCPMDAGTAVKSAHPDLLALI